MIKSLDQRNRILLIFLTGFSLLLWCYLFRFFLNGGTLLQGDAAAYFGHIRFYLENITRGVYPLWNPLEQYYNVNEFFLRRIGEFNPFFWVIVFLNKSGLPFVIAYRFFLAGYFFLGVSGFYLLAWKLFHERLVSFTAALLLFFSCIGADIFDSFLLLEIVPFIWFAYFLVAFTQDPRKAFFLGCTFTLMIINITYIPFYFYTILLIFLFCFFAVYNFQAGAVCRKAQDFIGLNKIFVLVCTALLALSFIPGILWYQQTCRPEIFMMHRHVGSQYANISTVSIDRVNEGGIIPNLIFDKQFVNIDRINLHDFYVPLFAFLMLFAGLWGRLNRRLVLFFIFGFTVFLIGLADASFVHKFLYRYVPFFRYFRSVQFFLQFAILPVFILFVVEQMRIFIEDCKQSSIDRKWMTLWVVLVHACAAGLFLYNHVGGITYAAIVFNLAWMLGRIWSIGSMQVLILLLWGSMILQPFEVYNHIASDYPPSYQSVPDKGYNINLPSVQGAEKIRDLEKRSRVNTSTNDMPYFGTCWLYKAMGTVDHAVLTNYLNAPFIIYDQGRGFSGKIDPDRWFGLSKARIITSADQDFKILKFDANDVIVGTTFTKPVFLVRAQYYHSGWKAFIDGKLVSLSRANICFQGLWVPAGEHVVHWHFGALIRYFWAYFLMVLYPLVLMWLICLSLI